MFVISFMIGIGIMFVCFWVEERLYNRRLRRELEFAREEHHIALADEYLGE